MNYSEADIKLAFYRIFHKQGELWFPYDEQDEEGNERVTAGFWVEFLDNLKETNE